jgi:hypothetical protein
MVATITGDFFGDAELAGDCLPVLRILIRRIRIFLDLLDPHPLVRGPDPDHSIMKQKKQNLDSYCFVTSF